MVHFYFMIGTSFLLQDIILKGPSINDVAFLGMGGGDNETGHFLLYPPLKLNNDLIFPDFHFS